MGAGSLMAIWAEMREKEARAARVRRDERCMSIGRDVILEVDM